MLFGKKKKMIDIRTLHRGSVVRTPKKVISATSPSGGYVDFSSKNAKSTVVASSAMSFLDSRSSASDKTSFSTESDGYSKREVDAKMTELDNKVYRLEQRVELLERKAGVGGTSSQGSGLIGW